MPLPTRKAGKKGRRLKDLIPSNARWLLTDLLGIDKTFTEKDLTRNELDWLKESIGTNLSRESDELDWSSEGKNPISFYYPESELLNASFKNKDLMSVFLDSSDSLLDLIKQSYDPHKSLATTLGMALLSKDEQGNYIIRDNYDFNYNKRLYGDIPKKDIPKIFFQQLKKGKPYRAFQVLSGGFGTSEFEETGNPVRINLGRLFD